MAQDRPARLKRMLGEVDTVANDTDYQAWSNAFNRGRKFIRVSKGTLENNRYGHADLLLSVVGAIGDIGRLIENRPGVENDIVSGEFPLNVFWDIFEMISIILTNSFGNDSFAKVGDTDWYVAVDLDKKYVLEDKDLAPLRPPSVAYWHILFFFVQLREQQWLNLDECDRDEERINMISTYPELKKRFNGYVRKILMSEPFSSWFISVANTYVERNSAYWKRNDTIGHDNEEYEKSAFERLHTAQFILRGNWADGWERL